MQPHGDIHWQWPVCIFWYDRHHSVHSSTTTVSLGMSTFSTPGGLYERAQKRFGLQDGKKLFCYSFFDRQRLDVQPFFADIYDEALRARAAPGHRAIADIHAAGKLLRHYTLNIDGLAAVVGMDTWHPDNNPNGAGRTLSARFLHGRMLNTDITQASQWRCTAAYGSLYALHATQCVTSPTSESSGCVRASLLLAVLVQRACCGGG